MKNLMVIMNGKQGTYKCLCKVTDVVAAMFGRPTNIAAIPRATFEAAHEWTKSMADTDTERRQLDKEVAPYLELLNKGAEITIATNGVLLCN